MVIGGASIYEQFIDYSSSMLLTEIDAECRDADVYFPLINEDEWDRSIISCENENNIKLHQAGGEIEGGRGQVPDTGADTGNQILCMNPRPIPVSLSN